MHAFLCRSFCLFIINYDQFHFREMRQVIINTKFGVEYEKVKVVRKVSESNQMLKGLCIVKGKVQIFHFIKY